MFAVLQMELRVAKLTTEKEEEIALRDEKLNRLKTQMADALKGNSWSVEMGLQVKWNLVRGD